MSSKLAISSQRAWSSCFAKSVIVSWLIGGYFWYTISSSNLPIILL